MRGSRRRSKSGYYHLVIRGVNKQNIFYEECDMIFFKLLMKKFGKKYSIIYHAYALMDNHVHLLIEDPKKNLSKFMQVLCSVYARYFNRKYDRIGHLYQDRFASETIENNGYLVIVCRYILLNPEKAGICKAHEYKWSSYNAYKSTDDIICKKVFPELLGKQESFYNYIQKENTDECLEIGLRPSEKAERNIQIVKKILGTENPIINPALSENEKLLLIKRMRKQGLSINTISRITGVGRYVVRKA